MPFITTNVFSGGGGADLWHYLENKPKLTYIVSTGSSQGMTMGGKKDFRYLNHEFGSPGFRY